MSERRTGPWTKEEHDETRARLWDVDSVAMATDHDALLAEAIWMGNEALPRALDEIERLTTKIEAVAGDPEAINAEVEKRALALDDLVGSLCFDMAFWRGIVRPGVEREASLNVESNAGWAIAKARLAKIDALNMKVVGLERTLEASGTWARLCDIATHTESSIIPNQPARRENDPLVRVCERMRDSFIDFERALDSAQSAYHNHEQWGAEQHDPLSKARTEFYEAFDSIQAIGRKVKPTKPESEHQRRVRECMERIRTLPKLEQHKAMARASRSYSAPESCIQDYGCRIEGTFMRWPDGELYPLRQDGELPGGITFIEPPGNI